MRNNQIIDAQANAATGFKSVLLLPVEDVIAKPQVRRLFIGIDELASSLLTEGQQSPIIVYPANKQGKYLIQKGERRWRACKQAGISHIEAIVNDVPADALEETAGELIENIQRENLTAVEIASALNKFIEAGWKQVDIATRIGKSSKYVSSHLGLLKMPPCVVELYEKRAVNDADTLNILRQIYELDSERCLELCRTGLSQGLHRQHCRYVLSYMLSKIKNRDKGSTRRTRGRTSLAPVYLQHAESPRQLSTGATSDLPWVSVPHHAVVVLTEIQLEGVARQARLLTDRISFDKSLVWVEVPAGDGTAAITCVNVADLRLLSISD